MKKHPKLTKALISIGMIALIVVIIVAGMRFLFPSLYYALKNGDPEALKAFLKQAKGPKMLIFLFVLQFVQIISIVLPSPPIHIAGGMVAGTLRAFTTCIISYTLANLVVFVFARKFQGKLNRLDGTEKKKDSKLTEMLAGDDAWIAVVLACMVPLIANGLIPYAAAQTKMSKKTFTASVFVGGFLPTLLLCAIGSNIMQADFPFILLLVSIDLICMWEVYDHKDDVVNTLRKIAAFMNARKEVRAREKAEKKAVKEAKKNAPTVVGEVAKQTAGEATAVVAATATEVPQQAVEAEDGTADDASSVDGQSDTETEIATQEITEKKEAVVEAVIEDRA